MQSPFVATREDALRRLEEFLPRAGTLYARDRNTDRGPADRSNVSLLSPYLRHRLIGEDEVVRAVLRRHHIGGAAKFVEEICWRTYWKGWLEQRPAVWQQYLDTLARDQAVLAEDGGMARRYEAAVTGRTGMACFDAWAGELTTQGYLHNHARMWFASIWIFTLNLPWALGADHFYRHLIDGDPASNTLSWRWVAGLHTEGKPYVARAANIAEFTGGRFNPEGQLNESPEPLSGEVAPAPTRLRPLLSVPPGANIVLLLGEDDLSPERWPVDPHNVRGVASLPAVTGYGGLSDAVLAFRNGAIQDGLDRTARRFGCPALAWTAPDPAALAAFCQSEGAEIAIIPQVPIGPARTALDGLVADLSGTGLSIMEVRRDWDSAFWPYARAGFFKLKERIPETLERLGLM